MICTQHQDPCLEYNDTLTIQSLLSGSLSSRETRMSGQAGSLADSVLNKSINVHSTVYPVYPTATIPNKLHSPNISNRVLVEKKKKELAESFRIANTN